MTATAPAAGPGSLDAVAEHAPSTAPWPEAPGGDGPGRGIRARSRVEVRRGPDGRARLGRLRTQPPLGVRLSGGEVHLVGTAAGPMGGDDLALEVDVGAGTDVAVRSVAATVVLPGDGRPSRLDVAVAVAAGARLDWCPQPVVVAHGSRHHADTTVRLAPGADLVWSEQVVLGRSGERSGHLASILRIERGGEVLVHHGLDTATAWDTPAVGGGRRATGIVVLVGAPATTAADRTDRDLVVRRLADDVVIAVALADDALALARRLESVRSGGRPPGAVPESIVTQP